MRVTTLLILPVLAALCGCSGHVRHAHLGEVYNETIERIGHDRNPVIVIPGIQGSNLRDAETGRIVWGAFKYGAVDPDFAGDLRIMAHPMGEGVALSELRDSVEADGALTELRVDIGLIRDVTALRPYHDIMATLAAGRYRDEAIETYASAQDDIPTGGAVEYANGHYTCYQFDYDWRRDITENMARLDRLVNGVSRQAMTIRGTDEPVKVDIVAHSMGGLLLRYYLRYGAEPLPAEGPIPAPTWAGAERVEHAILVGTPNAGSILALQQIVEGVRFSPITPTYRPALLGTMPAIYQLMPRSRHAPVIDETTGMPVGDLYDPDVWVRMGWGLVDPKQARVLADLLPDVEDPEERRRIAIDHLTKCLDASRRLHEALDQPSEPPAHVHLQLIAGDSESTVRTLSVDPATGRLRVLEEKPGDGTVLRSSALMDEREDGAWSARVRTPIAWDSVIFIFADHVGMTADPAFADNMLYTLLERPR